MRRFLPAIVLLIPLVSLVTGALLLWLATNNPDPEIDTDAAPLSKISWRTPQQ